MILAGSALVCAVSCAEKESLEPAPSDARVPMTFTAEAPATKTALQDDGQVFWTEGDAIGIFDGSAGISKFTATNADGASSTAEFSGSAVPGADYYAIYPYSEDASFSGNILSSILPAEQHYVEGTFETMLNPSAAKASGGSPSLFFSNVASILQVNLSAIPDGKTVREIKVTANESVAGAYTVDMSKDEYAAAASGETVSSITYKAETGSLPAGVYNIVLLPGTYSEMKLFIVFDDCSYVKMALKDDNAETMTLSASKIAKVDISSIPESAIHTDLYSLFISGQSITIAGKQYNKSQYAEDEIIYQTTSRTISTSDDGKIFFVDFDNAEDVVTLANVGDVIIVGVDSSNKPLLKKSGRYLNKPETASGLEKGRAVMANLDIDFSDLPNAGGTVNYRTFILNSEFGELSFDNCDIILPANAEGLTSTSPNALIAWTNASRSIDEINIVNCNIRVPVANTNHILYSGSVNNTLDSFKFNNNVVYCPEGSSADFALIRSAIPNTNNSTQGLEIISIEINNNTFVNANTSTNFAVFTKNIGSVSIKDNLIWSQQLTGNCGMLRYSTDSAYPAPTGTAEHNLAYIGSYTGSSALNWLICYGGNNALFEGAEQFTIIRGTDPFTGGAFNISSGIFIPNAENSTYGAQRSLPEEGAVAEAFDDLANVDGSFDYKTN